MSISTSHFDDEDGLGEYSLSDEESPHSSTIQDLVARRKNDSVERVPLTLTKGLDDLEFNEEFLLAAIHSIVQSVAVSI